MEGALSMGGSDGSFDSSAPLEGLTMDKLAENVAKRFKKSVEELQQQDQSGVHDQEQQGAITRPTPLAQQEQVALRRAEELKCTMEKDCKNPVSMIDNKGFVYCAQHGAQRKSGGIPCRKLTSGEIKKLERDESIHYS
jgi:hypothetical protein